MQENHYVCVVRDENSEYHVNVFSEKEYSKDNSGELEELKRLAIDAVVEWQKGYGVELDRETLVPISFRKKPKYIF